MYHTKLLKDNGENDNDFDSIIESKKRKIDEKFHKSDDSNGPLISRQGKDKHNYVKICDVDDSTRRSEDNVENNIDVTLQREHGEINSALNNNTPNISIAIENDNNINKQSGEVGTIGWKCLLDRIGELEEKILNKVSSEIATLKRSWEKNIYELKHTQEKELKQLTLQIEELKQENARNEEQKQCLMKEKIELEEKLKQEQRINLELSGIPSKDTVKTAENHNAMLEKFENINSQLGQDNENIALHNITEMDKNETEKFSQNAETHEESYKSPCIQESRMESNQDPSVPPTSIRDNKPPLMSTQKLADEIRTRRERRNNIIMKGMRPSTGNLMDDIIRLIQRKTGITPQIKKLRVIKSGVLLEMKSLANKLEIIRRSGSLRVLNITLEDDLTPRERLVQNWLKEMEAEDRKLGKNTVATFFKIKQDGIWKVWNERLGQLVIDERTPFNRGTLNDT